MSARGGPVVRIHPVGASVRFLRVETRVPLKFGPETLTSVTCARVSLAVEDESGHRAVGWGETPLSVQWVWPSSLSHEERRLALEDFAVRLAGNWARFRAEGHPIEIGADFTESALRGAWREANERRGMAEPMPWLAALVCSSAFDLALHDAYGRLMGAPVWETYTAECMSRDLGDFLEPAEGSQVSFRGRYPSEWLVHPRRDSLVAWHLVGGKDPIGPEDLTGGEPEDGYPVLLRDWIRRDGLRCLKVKLRGDDASWDLARMLKVGELALEEGVHWLSADFNCTVRDPAYVNSLLDRLRDDYPRIHAGILYVEQPFPYELSEHPIDVHSVSSRKPLFLDESAHDWRLVRLGRGLGWNGVALKTCKTQTGAVLALAWAKAHGMGLMVQDLTNPMLAQIPHVLLAAHAGTIQGVETNAMQFYPEASRLEAEVHPGLYRRREGRIELSSIRGHGFGYRLEEMRRELPPPRAAEGSIGAE